MSIKLEVKERLAERLKRMKDATTPTELAYTIWTKQLEEAMEALLALGYKAAELKKIRKFFEGTNETAEQYIKSSLKMLMKA